jgi:hypothetical protein
LKSPNQGRVGQKETEGVRENVHFSLEPPIQASKAHSDAVPELKVGYVLHTHPNTSLIAFPTPQKINPRVYNTLSILRRRIVHNTSFYYRFLILRMIYSSKIGEVLGR